MAKYIFTKGKKVMGKKKDKSFIECLSICGELLTENEGEGHATNSNLGWYLEPL